MEEGSQSLISHSHSSHDQRRYTFLTEDNVPFEFTAQEVAYCNVLKNANQDADVSTSTTPLPQHKHTHTTWRSVKEMLHLLAHEQWRSTQISSLFLTKLCRKELSDKDMVTLFGAADYVDSAELLTICSRVLAFRARIMAKIDRADNEVLEETCNQTCAWLESLQLSHEQSMRVGEAFLQQRATLSAPVRLSGHTDCIECVAYDPQEHTCATGSKDKTIIVWDTLGARVAKTLQGHTDTVKDLCYIKEGTQLVSAAQDKTLRLWDLQEGSCIKTLKIHTAPILSVDYCGKKDQCMSGGADETILVWDAQTSQCIQKIDQTERKKSILYVQYAADGNLAAFACAQSKKIIVWDIRANKKVTYLKNPTHVGAFSYSPDNTYIAAGTVGQLLIWDLRQRKHWKIFEVSKTSTPRFIIRAVKYNPLGTQIATCAADSLVRIWDLHSPGWDTSLPLSYTGNLKALSYSWSGHQVAYGTGNNLEIISLMNTQKELVQGWPAPTAVAWHWIEKKRRKKEEVFLDMPLVHNIVDEDIVKFFHQTSSSFPRLSSLEKKPEGAGCSFM